MLFPDVDFHILHAEVLLHEQSTHVGGRQRIEDLALFLGGMIANVDSSF